MAIYCAAVDWDTTRFCLWLLDPDGNFLAEKRSDDGLVRCQARGFSAVLEDHLAALSAPASLPVIICGMAGSRQGWQEAPYRSVPTPIREIGAHAISIPDCRRDVRILPGVAQGRPMAPDVMRGEETQLSGACRIADDATIFCLPGTHCKWARVKNGHLDSFTTFMTGELFALIGDYSVIQHVLPPDKRVALNEGVFREAIGDMLESPERLSSRLFSIRAASLLGRNDSSAAQSRLSGLLIVAEIAAARRTNPTETTVALVATGQLAGLYEMALSQAAFATQLIDAHHAVQLGLAAAARQIWSVPTKAGDL